MGVLDTHGGEKPHTSKVFEEELAREGVDTMQTVSMTSVLTARGRSEEVRPTGSQENRNPSGVGWGASRALCVGSRDWRRADPELW